MKKILIIFLTILTLIYFGAGCSNIVKEETKEFTITFVQENQEDIVRKVKEGEDLIDVPTPVQEEGFYAKWDRTDFSNIKENLVVTAVIEKIVYYKITFKQEGQADIVRSVESGKGLLETEVPTPKEEVGYKMFWDKTDFNNITEDLTVTAIKRANKYRINFDFDNIETNEQNYMLVSYNESFVLPTPTADEYKFVKWINVETGLEFISGVYNISKNLYLKAIWEKKQPLTAADYVDFVVNVEEGRDIRVLQLTDIQTVDSTQKRYATRVSANFEPDIFNYYHKYIGQIIENYKPDFIIMTGDNVQGEFDDSGKRHLELIKIMDSFKIPWAPIFGNHDNESFMGADWQSEQFEKSEYCLFKQRTLTGNGNYSVGIMQGGELKRVFYMLDSNGCSYMSQSTKDNGHSRTTVGFGDDQIAWYTESITTIKEKYPNTKFSMAFHIQLAIFSKAFEKYGYSSDNKVDIDALPDSQKNGDFGYIGRPLKNAWDTDYAVWNGIKSLGVDSIFVGHEHCNSASIVYEGVRLTYGQKSSIYDRFNSKDSQGNYTETATGNTPVIGGTSINISSIDGTITSGGLCLYDEDVGYEKPNIDISIPTQTATYKKYTLKELGNKSSEIKGGEKAYLSLDEKSYSVSFSLSASTFNGAFVVGGYLKNETSAVGVKVTFTNSSIKIGNAELQYNFSLGKDYDIEVGFVNLYNGNTTKVFVNINGSCVLWEYVDAAGKNLGNLIISANKTGDSFFIE